MTKRSINRRLFEQSAKGYTNAKFTSAKADAVDCTHDTIVLGIR